MRAFKIIALVLLLGFLFCVGGMTYLMSPKDSSSSAKQDVEIQLGNSRTDIAKKLYEAGIIRSEFALFAYMKLTKANAIPGIYEFSPSMSGSVIAEKLANGEYKTVKATIIEGWRAKDIETYLVDDKGLTQMNGFAEKAESYEGYLFPDTYELPVNVTIEEVIKLLRDNFDKRTSGLDVGPDAVILASIVEREAASDSERSDIAGVYANRLKSGMKLEADPTIQYAKGNWKSVTLEEYHSVISPYNTYLNEGLPPGPICNPGLASIRSALSPTGHNYYFFFHAQGNIYLSTTYEQHRVKVAQYF